MAVGCIQLFKHAPLHALWLIITVSANRLKMEGEEKHAYQSTVCGAIHKERKSCYKVFKLKEGCSVYLYRSIYHFFSCPNGISRCTWNNHEFPKGITWSDRVCWVS